jgi:anaerobic magnesium-protoporphyrin IX monomethyl ester cyclase
MNILLINPPVVFARAGKATLPLIENLFFNSPPLGLAYIAAVLEKAQIPVSIIDAAVERLTPAQVVAAVRKINPRIVGITATTNLFDSALQTARLIKEELPEIVIVLGGPHLNAMPRQAMEPDCFDIGVMGEGEITFLELIKAIESKKELATVNGIIFKRDAHLVFNQRREPIADLDSLPFPARHLLPMKKYRPQPNDQLVVPKLSMIASRGCPYGCIFCDKNTFGDRYRSFGPRYIVSEIKHLIDTWGARDIAFLDSTFTVDAGRVRGIIDEMKKEKIKVRWTCTVRANVVTRELLRQMKDAGCWRIRLGIESGNDDVLRFIRKGITRQQAQNAACWASEAGLEPKGFFMIGHLTDTKERIEETIAFARSLPLKDVTVQINTPMPGTTQYDICRDYGTLLTEDAKEFSYWEPVFVPAGLTREYLESAYRRFYRSFYLRPAIFWRHLRTLRHWYNLVKYIKSLRLLRYLFFGKAYAGSR